MKGLVIKDLLVLRQQAKTMAIMLLFFGVMGFTQTDASFFAGFMMMMMAMLPVTALSYDERAHWDAYALTMPLSRTQVVGAKYLLGGLLLLVAGIACSVFILILGLFRGEEMAVYLPQQLFLLAPVMSIGLLYLSVLLPIIYKMGTEKARLVMMVIFLIPFLFLLLVQKMGFSAPSEQATILALKLLPLGALAAACISFWLSVRFYKAKEF